MFFKRNSCFLYMMVAQIPMNLSRFLSGSGVGSLNTGCTIVP